MEVNYTTFNKLKDYILSVKGIEYKILLILLAFDSQRGKYESPYEITTWGIGDILSMDRSNLPRYLIPMVENGLVTSELSHVIGKKNRIKCYQLTKEGVIATLERGEGKRRVLSGSEWYSDKKEEFRSGFHDGRDGLKYCPTSTSYVDGYESGKLAAKRFEHGSQKK